MSFRGALDRVLGVLFADTPADVVAALAPWVDLTARLGPTPRDGPLHHDLSWPSDAVGINVFDHGPDLVMPVARAFARDVLGDDATADLAELERRLPARTRLHAGACHDRRGWRLKLWAGGPRVTELAAIVGVRDGDWTHLGVDLRAGGLERARGYRRASTVDDDWRRAFRDCDAWLDDAHDPPGVSHRIVAELGPWSAPDAKRSFDTIFGPEATIDDLLAEQHRSADLGVPPAPAPEALRALEVVAIATGYRLRPAAYEIDVHPDRPPRPDLLLTLAEP